MAIIRTKRNWVYAYEPLPRDRWVVTMIGNKRLPMQPIDHYHHAVAWAVSMADQFEHHLNIVPMDIKDWVEWHREQVERWLAQLTPKETEQLRRDVIATCVEVLRDCDDRAVRIEAHDLLVNMAAV